MANLSVIDDVGGALRNIWDEKHAEDASENPWSLRKIDKIKNEFQTNEQATKDKYPELFYYYDGMLGVKVSQSVHPAGMVISPINLDEEYGVFNKDGERCLVLDMDETHDVGGIKYDLLVLKTVQIIRDTCRYMRKKYPRTYEIDWNDQAVWDDMLRSPYGVFQFENRGSHISLQKFHPKNIFDMSLVTAAIRPSGASYRNDLLARRQHHNPSAMIDELLKNNLGYLVYQEDIIAFLQQICGLSGSASDTVRRGISKKKVEVLQNSLPKIIDGYCSKSDKPREIAEQECQEFIQVIEDSSSYMFGYNHAIAYCLLGYLCAYYRYYHPVEFITSYLNNAANDDDIQNGTLLAKLYGIKITSPKFGISRGEYAFDLENKVIAKGLSSIKYIGAKLANSLYEISNRKHYELFTDFLIEMKEEKLMDSRQLDILIHIDYFSQFGNQRELENIVFFWNMFKAGDAKTIRKDKVEGSYIEEILKQNCDGKTKSGGDAASYKITDAYEIIRNCERKVLSLNLPDFGVITKTRNYTEAMGYVGYVSNKEEDRPKLFIRDSLPLKRKSDGKQFGYSVLTQSIGSGIESRFTVFNNVYNNDPITKGDVIKVIRWHKDKGQYFVMDSYRHIRCDDDPMEALEEHGT
jgi:DNA polymerase III subunit alpha